MQTLKEKKKSIGRMARLLAEQVNAHKKKDELISSIRMVLGEEADYMLRDKIIGLIGIPIGEGDDSLVGLAALGIGEDKEMEDAQ